MNVLAEPVAIAARVVSLGEAVELNPRADRGQLSDDLEVSFVPMAAVEAATGRMDVSTVRRFSEVKKGYTIFREGDVLFAKITPCMENGKMAVARGLRNGVGCGSTEFHVLRPRPGVDPHYVYYFVSSGQFRARAAHHMTGAVGQKRVPVAHLEQCEIPLPDLEEQRRIVAEIEKQFSRLDEAVANLERVKVNLECQAAAVLSAAVSGRLLGPSKGQAHVERPDMAPLVELPDGWSWAATAEVCDVIASGSTPKPQEMTTGSGEVPFIKVYNLCFDGSLDFTVKPTFIRHVVHEGSLARSRCRPGDVLMNIVGPPLGKVSLVTDEYPEWNINQAVVVFRPGPRILSRLLAYWLMSPPVRRRIERTSKATAGQFNVQVSTCRKIALPIPPLDQQHQVVAEVDRRLSIIREVEAAVDMNLRRAQALRNALLWRSFSRL